MLNKDQNQDVGAGGIAVQAGRDVIVGVSAAEARAIAQDIAKLTFYELTGLARETMSNRVEEITEKVILKIEKEYPEGLKKATDPDFQHSLYTVQKQYGRCGDEELGDLLVDLLVERSKQDERSMMQIVLNESLEVAPKLTSSQTSLLAIVFLLRYTIDREIVDHLALAAYFDRYVKPFAQTLKVTHTSFQHLEYAGCGSVQVGRKLLGQLFLDNYPGLFTNGFWLEDVTAALVSAELIPKFFIRCLNDSNKLQVCAVSTDVLENLFEQHQVGAEDRSKILSFFPQGQMNIGEVQEKCERLCGYMQTVFSCWFETEMKGFTLTSVGIAIGHATLKRALGGEFARLSIWIE